MGAEHALPSRREFLRHGLVAGIGLSIGNVTLDVHAQTTSQTRGAVFVCLDGGLSQVDGFDAKKDAPSNYNLGYTTIATPVGSHYANIFPRIASLADRYTLVRTLRSSEREHSGATRQLLSAQGGENFLATLGNSSHARGFPYVYLEANFSGRDAVVRPVNEEFHDTHKSLEPRWEHNHYVPPSMETPKNLPVRMELLEDIDRHSLEGTTIDHWKEQQRRAVRLLLGKGTHAFDDPSDEDLERYAADHPIGRAIYVAGRLAEEGAAATVVRCGHWDFHDDAKTHTNAKAPLLDRPLSALITDVENGTLPDTVIGVAGEFGRTPTINKKGGRDHWIDAHSGIFYGGSFSRGEVIGMTDKHWRPLSAPIPVEHVREMIRRAVGLPAKPEIALPSELFRARPQGV